MLNKLLPFQFFFHAMKTNHVLHVEKFNAEKIIFLDVPRRWKVGSSLKEKVVPFDLSQCLLNHRNQEQGHMKDCNIPQINTIEAKAIYTAYRWHNNPIKIQYKRSTKHKTFQDLRWKNSYIYIYITLSCRPVSKPSAVLNLKVLKAVKYIMFELSQYYTLIIWSEPFNTVFVWYIQRS